MWVQVRQQKHMKGGGGPQQVTSTTETKSEPWAEQKPYLEFGFEQAREQYDSSKPQFFPGATYVPFSGQTEQALGMAEQRAMQGSPVQDMGQQNMQATLAGQYAMGGNPAYDAMVERSIRPMRREYEETVMPGLASQFAGSGRYGSPSYAQNADRLTDTYLRNVGDVGAGLALQNYESERGRMDNAMMNAPAYAQTDYNDINQLAKVGQAYEGLEGAKLGDEIQRFNFDQQKDIAKLGNYMNLVEGQYGGTSTATQQTPYFGANTGMQAAGLGLQGASVLGSMFSPMGPFGGK